MDSMTARSEPPHLERPPIERVPAEIITLVFDHLDYESHFDFAATSKFIYSCAGLLLGRHQRAHHEYAVASDLDPVTVPQLLRFAVRGSLEAWHVRDIELWHSRREWNEWLPMTKHEPPHDANVEGTERGHVDSDEEGPLDPFDRAVSPTQWEYQPGEISTYLNIFRGELQMSDDQVDLTMEQLFGGDDGPLKVLLIALCPRIRNLKVVRGYSFVLRTCTFMNCLLKALFGCGETEGHAWPPGFASLKQVAIGVSTGNGWDSYSVFPDAGQEIRLTSEPIVVSLLHLPSLKSLYISHPGVPWDFNHLRYSDTTTSGLFDSSPVEHIFLDGDPNVDVLEIWETIFSAPRALKTLSLRSEGSTWYDVDDLIKVACENQKQLQSLLLYGELRGYRCEAYQPDEVLLHLENNLRHLSIACADIITTAYYDKEGNSASFEEHWDSDIGWCLKTVAETIPSTLKILIIMVQEWRGRSLEMSQRCYEHIIETKRCPGLHTLCITAPPDLQEMRADDWAKWDALTNGLVQFGRQHDVEVQISTLEAPRVHRLDLPTSPEPADLLSGKLAPRRAKNVDWEVNPFTGKLQVFRGRDLPTMGTEKSVDS